MGVSGEPPVRRREQEPAFDLESWAITHFELGATHPWTVRPGTPVVVGPHRLPVGEYEVTLERDGKSVNARLVPPTVVGPAETRIEDLALHVRDGQESEWVVEPTANLTYQGRRLEAGRYSVGRSPSDHELRVVLLEPLTSADSAVVAEPEAIDHPPHYGGADDPYEAIKVIEAWGLGFHLGTVLKYIARHGKKVGEGELKDLKKARWYLDRRIELLEGGES